MNKLLEQIINVYFLYLYLACVPKPDIDEPIICVGNIIKLDLVKFLCFPCLRTLHCFYFNALLKFGSH